jgi:hypothetical protein
MDFNKEDLQNILENVSLYEDIDSKIAACIVGVAQKLNV